jgi:DUF1680 family protein
VPNFRFIGITCSAFLLWMANCGVPYSPTPSTQRTFLPVEQVQIDGELSERVDLTTRRLLSQAPFTDQLVLEDITRDPNYQRRFEQFEGDISGRYIGALSILSRLNGAQWEKHRRILTQALTLQQSGGWFGEDHQDNPWDGSNSPQAWGPQIFGHGRLLLGLVDAYQATGEAPVLAAAEQLAQYFTDTFHLWQTENKDHPWWGNFSCNLEAIMALYQINGDSALLSLARDMAGTISTFGRYHSHTYLSAQIGMVQLFLATGDAAYLQTVERDYWENIQPVSVNADGGIPEWFPVSVRTEGCSLVDWFKLNLELWRATGRGVYMDTAERVLLNGLYYHQCYSGLFGHTSLTSDGHGYIPDFDQSWWCCTMHGAQALGNTAAAIYAQGPNGVSVNFYTPSSASLTRNNQIFHISQSTQYPQNGHVRIMVEAENAVNGGTLRLRIPGWSTLLSLAVNQHPTPGHMKDGYAVIQLADTGPWTIDLELDMPLRIEAANGYSLWEQGYGPRTYRTVAGIGALYHGPLLLVQDGFYGNVTSKPLRIERLQQDGLLALEAAVPDPRTCRLPQSHVKVQTSDRAQTIHFAPISEATWHRPYEERLQNFQLNGGLTVRLWPAVMWQNWTLALDPAVKP